MPENQSRASRNGDPITVVGAGPAGLSCAIAPFGGFANFRLPRTASQGGHAVIGQQAGFQDSLTVFGKRYAIQSGLLAARSIVEGRDYTTLWRRELLPMLRTA